MSNLSSSWSVTEPSRLSKWVAGVVVASIRVITLLPLVWIISTGFKSPPDSISYPPKVVFEPSLEGYVNLFTTRTRRGRGIPGPAAARDLV
jgi:multiple sugar transport system permease protein